MFNIAPQVVSIAEACLGGLQGRSALLIGPEERRNPYSYLLRDAQMRQVYQEDTSLHIVSLLPAVDLLISVPTLDNGGSAIQLSAAKLATACTGRRSPLFIFDLSPTPSVEEMAGLLPAVCLYTPEDLRRIIVKNEMKAS
ncbi:hypothetical protein [Ktedonobacter racemifer]|jgi:hypothetical protein|uniref:Uncharacterized protein n=1 Tax=Ktedonobacter racemifer DSM 44963 TaxID=485913 RepID=D6TGK7_KTERA|nr:hypothetical protein [Ktedonobacter racemifer]EFH90719.1 hypothetical protein Krac_12352 [Ktedonobacter racemifer DSM 44963]